MTEKEPFWFDWQEKIVQKTKEVQFSYL